MTDKDRAELQIEAAIGAVLGAVTGYLLSPPLLPPPWTVDDIGAGFVVIDSNNFGGVAMSAFGTKRTSRSR